MSDGPTAADVVDAVVTGDRVELAEDPAVTAHGRRLTGASWAEVAAAAGYPSGAAAALAVSAMLQLAALERSAEARQAALVLELQRLDALQVAFWESAILGDLKAAKYVLDLSKHRAVLEKWAETRKVAEHRTIIITGEDMAEQLRWQVEGPPPLGD